MDICTQNIAIGFLFIIIIYLVINQKNISKNQENFALSSDDLTAVRTEINRIYDMDVEAIRNLGAISKSLLTGTNTFTPSTSGTPGDLNIPADNTILQGGLSLLNTTFEATKQDPTTSHIVSDTGNYKSLMITGNNSGDGNIRHINLYDDVSVNNNLSVVGKLTVAGESSVGGKLTVAGESSVGGNLSVDGNSTLNAYLTVGSGITLKNSNWGNHTKDFGHIISDIGYYKALMIAGNHSGDGNIRRINLYDDVSVNNNLAVVGESSIGGKLSVGGESSVGGNLSIGGNSTLNAYLTVGSGITIKNSNWGNNTKDIGHIISDIGNYKALMIAGNNSGGDDIRRVNIYDDLNVYQNLVVGSDLTVNRNLTINSYLSVGSGITIKNSSWGNNTPDIGHIISDTNFFKSLMIAGNNSSGVRKISLWDDVTINSYLTVGSGITIQNSSWVNQTADIGHIISDTNYYKSLMIAGNNSSGARKISLWDDVTINSYLTVGSGITIKNSSWSNQKEDTGHIISDVGYYKALMIAGNNSGGGNIRRVNIYDDLSVNRNLDVKGKLTGSTINNIYTVLRALAGNSLTGMVIKGIMEQ